VTSSHSLGNQLNGNIHELSIGGEHPLPKSLNSREEAEKVEAETSSEDMMK
jgi:hypothetical protein